MKSISRATCIGSLLCLMRRNSLGRSVSSQVGALISAGNVRPATREQAAERAGVHVNPFIILFEHLSAVARAAFHECQPERTSQRATLIDHIVAEFLFRSQTQKAKHHSFIFIFPSLTLSQSWCSTGLEIRNHACLLVVSISVG